MIRVLLVDDKVAYRQAITRLLKTQPDMDLVGVAGSLAEARTMLEGVDVALIDRGLPDGDGIELIGELRGVSPGAKVLVMSVNVEEAHPEEAIEAGADGVIDKIEVPQQVFATIRAHGGGR
jgi:DNA-binding NarL/FixJ family response regulator